MAKTYKRILIILAALAVLIVAINFGLEWYLNRKLPGLINKPGSGYRVTFSNIDLSLLRGHLHADTVRLAPNIGAEKHPGGIYVTIPALDISGIDILPLIYSEKVSANTLVLSRPDILIVKQSKSRGKNSKELKEDVVKPFKSVIAIANVACRHANVRIVNHEKGMMMNAYNLTARLGKVTINGQTVGRKMPFSYGEYALDVDSIFYRPDAFYHVRTGKIRTLEDAVTIDRPEYVCNFSRAAFGERVPRERDVYRLKASRIAMRKVDIGFHKNDTMFFHPHRISIEGLRANIYRDKRLPDDPKKKPLYGTLLRKVPFDLRVDTLSIRNALVEYEEQVSSAGPGKLRFDRFNLTATNLYSAFHRTKMKDVNIAVKCRFMKDSPLEVAWHFNVLNRADAFRIRGRILNFDVSALVPFTKPYMNVETEGILQQIAFDISGNDDRSTGLFAMKYDDFHVKVYRKHKRTKKNKLLTAIGNLFAKNDSKGHAKTVRVDVEREQDKSVYNFLWRNIAEGLKKVIL